jgi:hypothetical protein
MIDKSRKIVEQLVDDGLFTSATFEADDDVRVEVELDYAADLDAIGAAALSTSDVAVTLVTVRSSNGWPTIKLTGLASAVRRWIVASYDDDPATVDYLMDGATEVH